MAVFPVTDSDLVQMDRPVGSITIGFRRRHDLGDIDELASSIREHGLLQPITISPDGTLICGARRLQAVRRLGWRTVKVWIRTGVSSALEHLLAEQHENTNRKPFTPLEAAGMYRELKTLMAEDAHRRQRATRFGADADASDGATESVAPSDRQTQKRASQAVTGSKSYTRLEEVCELEKLATDPGLPDHVRRRAQEALDATAVDGKVHGHYVEAKLLALRAELEHLAADDDLPDDIRNHVRADLDALAHASATASPPALLFMTRNALRRARAAQRDLAATDDDDHAPQPVEHLAPRHSVRRFVLTWDELAGWTDHYDPVVIGPALSDDQWNNFETTLAASVAFATTAHQARTAGSPAGEPNHDDAADPTT